MDKYFTTAAIAGLLTLAAAPASATNLVVNGDFSLGNTGFTSGYALTTMTPYLFEDGVHGIYAVIPIGDVAGQSAYGDWDNVTKDPSGGNGDVFVADGADHESGPNTYFNVWAETVSVTPNTTYTFSYQGAEISNACCSNADFVATINGTQIGDSGSFAGNWTPYTYSWNSGSATTAALSLVDSNTSGGFNDFVFTDVSLSSGVPELSTWAMMGIGFAGLGFVAQGRARRKAGLALTAA